MQTSDYPSRTAVLAREALVVFDGASRQDRGYVIRKKGFHQQVAVRYPHTHMMMLPERVCALSPAMPASFKIGASSEDGLLPLPRAYHASCFSAWHFPHLLLQSRDSSVAVKVFHHDPTNESFIANNKKRVRGYVNSDGDEVWYVYAGSGICLTELGYLSYGRGDYLYMPQGFLYEICPDLNAPTVLFGMESRMPLLRPVISAMAEVPYDVNDLIPPCPTVEPYFHNGRFGACVPYVVAVKRLDCWSLMRLNKNPFEGVIGYKGSPYPFTIHTDKINVPVVDTMHTDPTMFMTFLSRDGSVGISTFRPRRIHSLPYYHDNTYDECMLLCGGYAARGGAVGDGDVTFHPQGFCHGPQPKTLVTGDTRHDPQDNVWEWQKAIMFESRLPLLPSRESYAVEIKGYWRSWIP